MSEVDDFKELFTHLAGFWPESKGERENIFWSSPGLLTCILAGAYQLGGDLSQEETKELEILLAGLLRILLRAHRGEEDARNQLLVVKKLLFPSKYQVPVQVIEGLAKKYNTSGPLARGWELRQLMSQLSPLVIPAKPDTNEVLKGRIIISETLEAKKSSLYQEASRSWRRNMTLQGLTIRIYLNRMASKGDQSCDERSLKRDLQKVREWESSDQSHLAAKAILTMSGQIPASLLLSNQKLSESDLLFFPPKDRSPKR
jgi:hypothetical protein